MALSLWAEPPTFASNQVASAQSHLQALAGNVRDLLGLYKGRQSLWGSRYLGDGWAGTFLPEGNYWRRVWEGYVRNKADLLGWGVYVVKDSLLDCKLRLTYDGNTTDTTIAAGAGTTTYTDDTIDASSLSGFYHVAIDMQALSGATPQYSIGDIDVLPLYVAEVDPQSYGSLHRFYSGDTPSVAEWQALSTRAGTLYSQLGGVNVPFVGRIDRAQNKGIAWATALWNRRYLNYDIRVKLPSVFDGGEQYYATFVAVASLNGTEVGALGYGILDAGTSLPGTIVLKDATYFEENQTILTQWGDIIQLGTKAGSTFTGCTRIKTGSKDAVATDWVRHWQAAQPAGDVGEEWTAYQGLFDLSGLGLSEGSRYVADVHLYYNSHGHGTNCTGAVEVRYLGEQAATTPSASGWSSMPDFAHKDTVDGAGSVKPIRDNLAWLSDSSRVVFQNYAMPRIETTQPPAVISHRLRWLHYFCLFEEGQEEPQPAIGYFYGNTWQEQVLPFEPNKWLAFDLSGLRGLWPGTLYRIASVSYCGEDSVS